MPKRITYFDYLRMAAAFAVMLVHSSATFWYKTEGVDFQIATFFDSISRWGVPVFVMISGALFLKDNISVKRIWTKHIPKIACAYIVWSLIYAIIYGESNLDKIEQFIKGPVHLWFLPMITGLYVITPVLRPIVKDEKLLKYSLAMMIVFAFVIPTVILIGQEFGGKLVSKGFDAILVFVNNIHLKIEYAAYFLLGYYLNETEISKEKRIIIYVLGLLGFVSTTWLTITASASAGEPSQLFMSNLTINVLFEAMAVFVLFKSLDPKETAFGRLMSAASFNAYLVHIYIMRELLHAGLNLKAGNIIPVTLALTILTYIISFAIAAALEGVKRRLKRRRKLNTNYFNYDIERNQQHVTNQKKLIQ